MALTHKPALLIFDRDGTLAHTLPQLGAAVQAVCRRMGYAVPSMEQVSDYIGNGIGLLLARALTLRTGAEVTDVPEAVRVKARQLFDEEYGAHLNENFTVYPGVRECLELCRRRGIKTAVLTNKAQSFAVPLLNFMGLADLFDLILGGEVLKERKPDPHPVWYVCEKLGVRPEDACMVGDSVNDFAAGRNAGTGVIAFTFGYNRGRDVRESQPDYVFDSYAAFISLLQSLPEN